MSAHTPGPWVLEPNARGGINIRCSWGVIGCAFSGVSFAPGEPNQVIEQRANAHLIAAAPDLLEALRELANDIAERFDMESSSTNPGMKNAVAEARAAIAKATGGKS
ncbi:hypothetical protein HF313_14955 [Massilia atriviolacea]|uniref:Uncharacterized protein n=1 Tax=Massilia atriviolacea TaxID=2495579 RepID=A0A430HR56_9BURK|nr:hypothetical protein [Massilia atriviolacea]RSZ60011.1 hypothetical protein EJB06_07480 [Massilia atriviolacea]